MQPSCVPLPSREKAPAKDYGNDNSKRPLKHRRDATERGTSITARGASRRCFQRQLQLQLHLQLLLFLVFLLLLLFFARRGYAARIVAERIRSVRSIRLIRVQLFFFIGATPSGCSGKEATLEQPFPSHTMSIPLSLVRRMGSTRTSK